MMGGRWTHPYVGIPWRPLGRTRLGGCDCWGLVRLVYGERGIALPDYGADPASAEETAAAIRAGRDGGAWDEVPPFEARALDLLVFSGTDHVGLFVDRRTMLHAARGHGTIISRHDLPPWRDRLVTVARHRDLAGAF